jgi:hypothetical protein
MKQFISIHKVVLSFSALLLFSCGDDQNKSNAGENAAAQTETVKQLSDEDKFSQKMVAIDTNQQLQVINGLAYNNQSEVSIQVNGYLDRNNLEVKIEEVYNDAKTGNNERTSFYIEGGKKFATRQIIFDNTKKPSVFTERISFYDKDQKVIFTKAREAEYEELLSTVDFKPVSLFDCKIDRAMRALNEEGEFETRFQGFVETKTVDYILVGANAENGFVSSLAVVMPNEFTFELKSNQQKYIGQLLEVQFQKTMEANVAYQALVDIRFK